MAARDVDALQATRSRYDGLQRRVTTSSDILAKGEARLLNEALADYYRSGVAVSRRLIAGETGESLPEAVRGMQEAQARASEQLKRATSFDRGELTAAFAAAERAEITARRVRLATSAACLALLVILSIWLGRGVLRSLRALTNGLNRFGDGHFERPIPILGDDELGDVARRANQMAERLQTFSARRDEADWLKGAVAGLGEQLRGDLEPLEVSRRAVTFLATYLEVPAAVLYGADAHGILRVAGTYAADSADPRWAPEPGPSFRPGEGLVGQAALADDVMIVREVPASHARVRSGLIEGAPCSLALLPITRLGRVAGVLELASFSPWPQRATEALIAVREGLAIALEAAHARQAMRDLLTETQRQTVRLSEQEEKLRLANDDLSAQQEELLQTNTQLVAQAETLDAQRRSLEDKNIELDEARRNLEQKANELSTVSAYKSRFLANMSHELRTPLNSMLLLSNLLAENEQKNLTTSQIDFAKTIHIAGEDLLRLINQVLDLAKIEAGKHELAFGPVTLRQLAANLRLFFEPLARDKGLDLAIETAAEMPAEITTDRLRVEQILKNLLANAIKFTSRGRVTLRIARPPANLTLRRGALDPARAIAFSVADTGVGIAPSDQERIFAPFEQVDAAPTANTGEPGSD